MPNLSEIEAHANPVRKGAWTLVLTPSLHRDPEVWGPDPEAFGPDRFDAAAVRARPAHTFKPWGTGARALHRTAVRPHEATLVLVLVLVLGLGLLLRRYAFVAGPGHRLTVGERLTLMPEGLTLRLERRRTAPAPSGRTAGPVPSPASEASARCPVHGAGD